MNRRMPLLSCALGALLSVPGAALVATAGPAGAVEGSWEATGALHQARISQTATLAEGGRVVVAGGRANSGALTSAEVYDSGTGLFTTTGSMATSRWSHTAALLPDGKVLVAGGFTGFVAGNAQAVTDTAEVYDPATGTWSPTGSMQTRRALHSTMVLPDGKVLVAGGRTCTGPPPATCDFSFRTATAEVYDPATGAWTPTGSMNAPRHTTSAATLPDGRVLVPAGFSAPDAHDTDNTADVYDPSAGTWSLTANLNRSRARQGAMSLHDGDVLVGPGSRATIFGPPFSATINSTTETYDPASNTWHLTAGLPLLPGRFNFQQATLPNGQALIVGGFGGPAGAEGLTTTAEVFDPATSTWASAGSTTHLHGTSSSLANTHDAVVLSANPRAFEFGAACGSRCGRVLVLGDNLNDPVADLYTPTAPVPVSLDHCKDSSFKGRSTASYTPFANQGLCVSYVTAAARRSG